MQKLIKLFFQPSYDPTVFGPITTTTSQPTLEEEDVEKPESKD